MAFSSWRGLPWPSPRGEGFLLRHRPLFSVAVAVAVVLTPPLPPPSLIWQEREHLKMAYFFRRSEHPERRPRSVKRSDESLQIANNVWFFGTEADPNHVRVWTKRRRL